jgi:hypothetical protein
LNNYSFDLEGYAVEHVTHNWLRHYPSKWVVAAIIEALYLGRYKAASVESILFLWCLRGQPLRHFDNEFACLVCGDLLKKLPVAYES